MSTDVSYIPGLHLRCPQCGETERVRCESKPTHMHYCDACGYNGSRGLADQSSEAVEAERHQDQVEPCNTAAPTIVDRITDAFSCAPFGFNADDPEPVAPVGANEMQRSLGDSLKRWEVGYVRDGEFRPLIQPACYFTRPFARRRRRRLQAAAPTVVYVIADRQPHH